MKFSALVLAASVASSAAFAPSFVSRPSFALDASRKPFISGNWKLNPQTKDEAVALAKGIADSVTSSSPDADVALFVPFVFIEAAAQAAGGKIKIGAEVRCAERRTTYVVEQLDSYLILIRHLFLFS
jgi:hypothetical protein